MEMNEQRTTLRGIKGTKMFKTNSSFCAHLFSYLPDQRFIFLQVKGKSKAKGEASS